MTASYCVNAVLCPSATVQIVAQGVKRVLQGERKFASIFFLKTATEGASLISGSSLFHSVKQFG